MSASEEYLAQPEQERPTEQGRSKSMRDKDGKTPNREGKTGRSSAAAAVEDRSLDRREPIPFGERKIFTVPVKNEWPAPVKCKMNIKE